MTYIIAEAGVNHNGDIELAKKMIDVASEAGVDCIKFQTFKADKLVVKNAPTAEYQKQSTGTNSQFDMLKKLELSFDSFRSLKEYALDRGVDFCSTAFDNESIEFLYDLGLKFWKIPSGELTNVPYIEKIAKYNMPIIMSTGMAEISEIDYIVNLIRKYNDNELIILHCNTEYPTPFQDVNLSAMDVLKERYAVKVGYSDHTKGIEVPIAATALGAKVIEKHFTLDRNMEGPDHKASLEPNELKKMVESIRNIEKAIGNKVKFVTESESKNKSVARKSIVAAKQIKKGEIFTAENLSVKRPGTGISPLKWHDILGKKSQFDYDKEELIKLEEV